MSEHLIYNFYKSFQFSSHTLAYWLLLMDVGVAKSMAWTRVGLYYGPNYVCILASIVYSGLYSVSRPLFCIQAFILTGGGVILNFLIFPVFYCIDCSISLEYFPVLPVMGPVRIPS